MNCLSTLAFLPLLGCLHLGVAPPAAHYASVEVQAPVAEAGVEGDVSAAILDGLASRGGLGGSEVVRVTVLAASLAPAGRSGAVELYRATLRLRAEVGGRSQVFEGARDVVDPGSAAGAATSREAVFRALAAELGPAVAAWAVAS